MLGSMPDFRDTTILVADGNAFFRDLLSSMLNAFRVGRVLEFGDVGEAWQRLQKGQIDCVVTEWKVDQDDGVDLISNIRRDPASPNRSLPIILCTGYTEAQTVLAARDRGVNAVLAKPISSEHLFQKLMSALFDRPEFIDADAYTGPDRRRRDRPYDGPERRTTIAQDKIDELME